MRARLGTLLLTAGLLLAVGTDALAHEGPPYPIIVDKTLGPCVLSVWSDPDVGTGTFFFILEPARGGRLPDDIRIDIGVHPVSGRLPEAIYAAEREDQGGRVQFKALVPFDAEELWRVRVRLQSAEGGGEAATDVEVTPPGYGRWDMLIYLLPFAAVGALWLRALVKGRGRHPRGGATW
ncbi:MAG TPA: hypothetical protein VN282_13395 [Pyrinomonadaceae bacterium]|nr:hypothetical protein [Pyrinomonadaceae bacterium]